MPAKMIYLNNCANGDTDDITPTGGLREMIDSCTDITRECFLNNVDRTELQFLEATLGYASNFQEGMTMADDRHITYHRSTLHGEAVFFFVHSCIEYVFVDPGSQLKSTWLNHYSCNECGESWEDNWGSQCDDHCPACDTSCAPTLTEAA